MNELKQGYHLRSQARRARGAMNGNQSHEKTRNRTRRPRRRNKSRIPIKRLAVHSAYYSLREIFHEFSIPCVKKTIGTGIVRICARSLVQLDNITLIMKELLEVNLIEEIGMPLEYAYKMKTLVLFLKPADFSSSMKLEHVFEKCSFKYHYIVIDVKYPVSSAKEKIKKKANPIEKLAPLDNLSKVIILVTIFSILLTMELYTP
jgi:hypothetical protein